MELVSSLTGGMSSFLQIFCQGQRSSQETPSQMWRIMSSSESPSNSLAPATPGWLNRRTKVGLKWEKLPQPGRHVRRMSCSFPGCTSTLTKSREKNLPTSLPTGCHYVCTNVTRLWLSPCCWDGFFFLFYAPDWTSINHHTAGGAVRARLSQSSYRRLPEVTGPLLRKTGIASGWMKREQMWQIYVRSTAFCFCFWIILLNLNIEKYLNIFRRIQTRFKELSTNYRSAK